MPRAKEKVMNSKHFLLPSVRTALLCLATLLASSAHGQGAGQRDAPLAINRVHTSSPTALTTSEGVSSDGATPYFHFNGFNGLKLPLSTPASLDIDYTISFWFRSS